MSVLIVDDTIFMRDTIKKMLEANNIEVIAEAENGKDAVAKYKSKKPKVVTMDITMPEMGGIDAIKQIKKIDPDANIIVCSSMGQELSVKQAIIAGAKSFLVKPFETERFIKEINKFL